MLELMKLFGRSYGGADFGVTALRRCTPLSAHVNIATAENEFYEQRLRVINLLKDDRKLYMVRPDGLRVEIPNSSGVEHKLDRVGQYEMYRKMLTDAVATGAVIFEVCSDTLHRHVKLDGTNMYKSIEINNKTFEVLPLDAHKNTYYIMTTEEELERNRYGLYVPWLGATIGTTDRVINKNITLNGYNRESGTDGLVSISYRVRSELGDDLVLYVEMNGMVTEVAATRQGYTNEELIDVIITEHGKERRIGTVKLAEALSGIMVLDELRERQHFVKMFRTKFEIDLYHDETKFREQKLRDELARKEKLIKDMGSQHDRAMKLQKESYEAKLRASDSSDKKNKSAAAQGWAGFLEKAINIVVNLGGLIFGIFSSSKLIA